jgi:hypothetical protein
VEFAHRGERAALERGTWLSVVNRVYYLYSTVLYYIVSYRVVSCRVVLGLMQVARGWLISSIQPRSLADSH